ncbi:L-lysine 6-monooxygenase (NADPH-requiring)-domain-containing protein [Collybia nuda]|uniref:L-ornithine N(5)-monooxygenase [NAD(P)H] n=1 Tax=Collybia nuda TaxID=64659 RepID=A0A9P5Y7H5_9AGAR|nr:L-lysine 6-monooxygenase (NADPH-requiring)-domain-containing protein [Collybia nuda]
MSPSPIDHPEAIIYDLVGLGFGPANLAIAGALVERWQSSDNNSCVTPVNTALFLEKHDKFRWHPGMLLPGARMQISFMKDLATLRSPQSPITFLAYLHSQNRLVAFINRGSTIPTRKEYADYLSWAAKFVGDNGVSVMYGREVIGISKGQDDTLQIRSRDVATGEERVVRARDLVISPGGAPRIPESLKPLSKHPFVIHSSEYITTIDTVLGSFAPGGRPLRIAVIGSGQSAAEVTMDLRDRLTSVPAAGSRHEVNMLIRKGSLKPSDDSPFANEIFDPASTNTWFDMPSDRIRDSRLSEYKSTNYGVVNPRTLEMLHEIIYEQNLDDDIAQRTDATSSSQPHIKIIPYTSVISTSMLDECFPSDLLLSAETKNPTQNTSTFVVITQNLISRVMTELRYDFVVCATGYQRSAWTDLLKSSDIAEYFGLHGTSQTVNLLPENRRSSTRHNGSRPTSVSNCSTPPTSPGPSTFPSMHIDSQIPDTVYISRNYQLLPCCPEASGDGDVPFKARIYLQGVEEATHGLSDTLLSVLGIRAGEVVTDLCNGKIRH